MNVVDTVKNAAFASAIQAALNYMDKDPETNIPKVMSIVDKAAPEGWYESCLLYTSPSPRDRTRSRMPSSA